MEKINITKFGEEVFPITNAQIKFLNNRPNLKTTIKDEILKILNQNMGEILSSHEIMNQMQSSTVQNLRAELKNYNTCGFAEPAGHVGSVCAELSQKEVLQHVTKRCSILGKKDDAFFIGGEK